VKTQNRRRLTGL